MLEIVASYAFGILIFLFIIYIVIWNFIHLGYWLRCLKMQTCTSKQCKFKHYCSKWVEVYTEEEIEELLQLIEQYRQKLKGQ